MSILQVLLSKSRGLLVAGALAALVCLTAAMDARGEPMSYGEARSFLAKYTDFVELTDGSGARVAIAPQWQGRVMTSTADGMEGISFGFIHREFIEKQQPDPRFNNYGGEDRMWLSPEGGQFSLWFKPGAEQKFDNWYTPAALDKGEWKVVSGPGDPFYRMRQHMELENASATKLTLDVTRTVRLLNAEDVKRLFGDAAAAALADPGVKKVGYETINTIANQGPPLTKEKGLVSIWMLGMYNVSPQTVVIVPYKPGDESQLGPVVKSDYFGSVPPERLKTLPEAILFRADAQYRAKIGVSQRRAKNVLGSIDFANNVLTLVEFTMPEDPTQHDYMNNMWELPQEKPYVGDVVNSYNDGPTGPGQPGLGPFYEIESLSPAKPLGSGESLTHQHRTLHIQADLPTLNKLAEGILGIGLEKVRQEMLTP
jgi:hypothetical protein